MKKNAKTEARPKNTAAPQVPANRLSRHSLFRRYFGFSLSSVLITLLVLFVVFVVFVTQYWILTKEDALKTCVYSVASVVKEANSNVEAGADLFSNTKLVGSTLASQSETAGADLFITDAEGTPIFCKEMIGQDQQVRNEKVCDLHEDYRISKDLLKDAQDADGLATVGVFPTISQKKQILVGTAIKIDGTPAGYVFAVVPYQATVVPYLLQQSRLYIGAAFVAMMLVLFFAYILSYRMVAPLQEMSRLTKKYAKGDFSERIYIKGEDELSDLAVSLNKMADSLSLMEKSRRNFVGNVSHELKTPMTTIGGFVDGILDGTIPPRQQKKYLQIVSKEVKRLSNTVVSMLSLSKIEAGEEQLHYTEVNMNQLMFDSLLCFEDSIDSSHYHVEGFEKMPPVTAWGDEGMLFQVLYNLFDNAVKFTERGGTIRVQMKSDVNRVTVWISNTGQGIPQAELNHVFERFYKLDKSRSENVKGVGLGLNLVKTIVTLHGGEITAFCSDNKVTTFTFWIPRQKPKDI